MKTTGKETLNYDEGDSLKMLLNVFNEHNRKYRELIDKNYVAGTVLRYERTARYLIFCSFTGLAFTDVQHLKPEHITKDSNGEYWIRKAREKTDNMCDIPLLDIPKKIMEKYKTHPECIRRNIILPVPSNQRMNSYLKEIADICGIDKPLSRHIARHTFATIALANKVSMESIAKMLGHTDIRTTKIYAKIMDKTIANEMQCMKRKFAI